MPADPPVPALTRRVFQSDALDAHVSLADLSRLSHEQLVRLGLELRQRLQLLESELQMIGRQCDGAGQGLSAEVGRAMVDLQQFLSFFEERVMHHRLRLRRAGKQGGPDGVASGVNEVA